MRDNNTGLLTHTATQTTSSSGAFATLTAMIPKRFARLALVTCLLVTVAVVYVTLFKHPPPDQVLKMNSKGAKTFNLRSFGNFERSHVSKTRELAETENEADESGGKEEEGEEENEKEESIFDKLDRDEEESIDDKVEDKHVIKGDDKARAESIGDKVGDKHVIKGGDKARAESKQHRASSRADKSENNGGIKGKAAWDKFIADNHHTVIGIVFDACENPSQQLGTVVLLPDTKNGGVMSRTFYNFTLDRVIDEGWTFNVDVKYNGQDLYDNWWEVCEMEDDLESGERTFVCPVRPGDLSLVKDKHIPGYIPKGRYLTKAWVKDSNNTVLLCGFSDFVL